MAKRKVIHAPFRGGVLCSEFGDGDIATPNDFINCKSCAGRLFKMANYSNQLLRQGYKVAAFPEPKPKPVVVDQRQLDLASSIR